VEKKREIRRLITKMRPNVFSIQETKLEVVDDVLCRTLWGSDDVSYSFKLLVGALGGILTMWDSSVVDIWMSLILSNALIVKGKFIKNNVDFVMANVYAPCDNRGRQLLWNELNILVQRYSTDAWCVLGDFNAVCSCEERRSRSTISGNDDFAPFNQFIDGNFLIDLPLCGRNFTWYRGDGLSMSRLDCFLLLEVWISVFPNCIQAALLRGLSDHCPIILTVDEQNWGPKPLRMLKCWPDIPDYFDFEKTFGRILVCLVGVVLFLRKS